MELPAWGDHIVLSCMQERLISARVSGGRIGCAMRIGEAQRLYAGGASRVWIGSRCMNAGPVKRA